MTSHRFRLPKLILALGLLSGCATTKLRQHESKELMDSATSSQVTGHQAADVEIAMARTLEDSGDLAKAEEAYREALKRDERRADAHSRLAILCDRKGDVKEASQHFARAVALEPKNPDYLCDQGYSFYLQGRWDEAEARLKLATEIDPHHARSHTNLGLVLARRGDEGSALDEFARAGCDRADAQCNLALVLATQGKFVEAKRMYASAIELKPGSKVAQEGMRAAMLAMGVNTKDAPAMASAPTADPAIQKASTTAP